MCSSCSGGNHNVIPKPYTKKMVDNSECGITKDRLNEIDRTITALYMDTKDRTLLHINKTLRAWVQGYKRMDLCLFLTQIEMWEEAYGDE